MSSSPSRSQPTAKRHQIAIDEELLVKQGGASGDALRAVLSTRKCWRKNAKGADELVWPPELEAAFFEGLELYRPSESKSTRTKGRFPMRNKFVSDYIYEKTKTYRSPKQVGSRIQQLGDTETGRPIVDAISDRHYAIMYPGWVRNPPQSSSESSTQTPMPTHYYIEVLPPQLLYEASNSATPPPIGRGRFLRQVNPQLAFRSTMNVECISKFSVYKDGMLTHEEVTTIDITEHTIEPTHFFLYTTTLVPGFWSYLCDAEDPYAYLIHQEIVSNAPSTSSNSQSEPLLTTIFHLIPPPSPMSSPMEQHAAFEELVVDPAAYSDITTPGPVAIADPLAFQGYLLEQYQEGLQHDFSHISYPEIHHHNSPASSTTASSSNLDMASLLDDIIFN